MTIQDDLIFDEGFTKEADADHILLGGFIGNEFRVGFTNSFLYGNSGFSSSSWGDNPTAVAFTTDPKLKDLEQIYYSFFLGHSKPNLSSEIFKRFENGETDIVSMFFSVRATDSANENDGEFDPAWITIGKNHVEMLKNETVDSFTQMWKVLDPWYSQLGFKNYDAVKQCFRHNYKIGFFNSDQDLFAFFKRFSMVTRMKPDDFENFGLKTKFSEVEEPFDLSFDNYPENAINYFLQFPFHLDSIISQVKELTVGEVRHGFFRTPHDTTEKAALEIFEKDLAEYRESNSSEAIRKANKLYNTFFDSMDDSMLEIDKMHEVYDYVMSFKFGVRLLMTELFNNNHGYFKTLDQFLELMACLTDEKESRKWVVRPEDYGDYILLKLCEKLGAVTAIEAIKTVYESDYSLTFSQWIELTGCYRELKPSPVSWWVALLG